MKNCRMNNYANKMCRKMASLSVLGDDIWDGLMYWKSNPNEDAHTDRVIEKIFDKIKTYCDNVIEMRKLAESAEKSHNQELSD